MLDVEPGRRFLLPAIGGLVANAMDFSARSTTPLAGRTAALREPIVL